MVDLQQVFLLLLCTVQFQRETEKSGEEGSQYVKPKFRLSSTTAALLNGIILGMLIFLDNDKTLIY